MEAHLKQSAVSATDSEHKIFSEARLKLTGLYVLILTLILFGFSTTLYKSFERNLLDASEDDFADLPSQQHFTNIALQSVRDDIFLSDFVLVVIVAGLSYALAGRSLKPIQRAVEAQKTFTANASHELRTPLAVMRNDTEVLLRNPHPTSEQACAVFQSNLEEIAHMSGIVEELLMLARSDNVSPIAFEKVDMTATVAKAASKILPLAKEKGVLLSIVSRPRELSVQGNASALERAVLNILHNAIEHTPSGGSVSVESFQENNEAVVNITDTGIGIDEKDVPHIFERFYKTVASSGSGLGLSIVQGIMTQHGGRIEIQSRKGKGTTASLRLPLA